MLPFACPVVLVFNFSEYTITSYGNYIYPLWAEVIGWLIAFGSCLPAVIVALYKVIAIVTTGSKETIKLRLRNQLTSTESFGSTSQHYFPIISEGILLFCACF
ncbi:Sodium- and chloride-dependent betaine transporter [Trichinella pseudospiralis]